MKEFQYSVNNNDLTNPKAILSIDLTEYINAYLQHCKNRKDAALKTTYKKLEADLRSRLGTLHGPSYLEKLLTKIVLDNDKLKEIQDKFAYHLVATYFIEMIKNTIDEAIVKHLKQKNTTQIIAALELSMVETSERIIFRLLDLNGRGFPSNFLDKVNDPLRLKQYLLPDGREKKNLLEQKNNINKTGYTFALEFLTPAEFDFLCTTFPDLLPDDLAINPPSDYQTTLFNNAEFYTLSSALTALSGYDLVDFYPLINTFDYELDLLTSLQPDATAKKGTIYLDEAGKYLVCDFDGSLYEDQLPVTVDLTHLNSKLYDYPFRKSIIEWATIQGHIYLNTNKILPGKIYISKHGTYLVRSLNGQTIYQGDVSSQIDLTDLSTKLYDADFKKLFLAHTTTAGHTELVNQAIDPQWLTELTEKVNNAPELDCLFGGRKAGLRQMYGECVLGTHLTVDNPFSNEQGLKGKHVRRRPIFSTMRCSNVPGAGALIEVETSLCSYDKTESQKQTPRSTSHTPKSTTSSPRPTIPDFSCIKPKLSHLMSLFHPNSGKASPHNNRSSIFSPINSGSEKIKRRRTTESNLCQRGRLSLCDPKSLIMSMSNSQSNSPKESMDDIDELEKSFTPLSL